MLGGFVGITRRSGGAVAILIFGLAILLISTRSRVDAGSRLQSNPSPAQLLAAHEQRVVREQAEFDLWLANYVAQPHDLRALPRVESFAHLSGGQINLPQAVKSSDLVVVGAAQSVQFVRKQARVSFVVAQVLKGQAAGTVTIQMFGGPRPGGSGQSAELEVTDAAPLLLPGDAAILFLHATMVPGEYQIQSYSGTYHRRDGRVYGLASSPFATPINGQLEADFIAAVRASVSNPPLPLSTPSDPTNARAGTITPTSIELRWDDTSGNETRFEIAHHQAGSATEIIATLPTNTSSWTHTGLQPSVRHLYLVRACNADGCSAWSDELDLTTTPVPGPTAPSNLQAGTITDTTIEITWQDTATTETRFEVQQRPNGAPAWTTVTLPPNTTSWTHSPVTPLTAYNYQVRACDASGCSIWAGPITVQSTVPRPTNLRIGTRTDTTIQVLWNDNTTLDTRQELQWKVGFSSVWSDLATLSASATSWVHPNTEVGQTYAYRVRSCTPAACSGWSDQFDFVYGVPTAPSALRAGAVTATSIEIQWNDDSTVNDRYKIEYRAVGAAGWQSAAIPSGTATSWTAPSLVANTNYEFRVAACQGLGALCSDWTGPVTVRTSP